MRVALSGGYCECETCGSLCDGRFNACAAVVSMPGYVPASAPTTFPEPDPRSEPTPEPAPAPAPVSARNGRVDEVRVALVELRAILDEALKAMTARRPRP